MLRVIYVSIFSDHFIKFKSYGLPNFYMDDTSRSYKSGKGSSVIIQFDLCSQLR